tara:strand:- start:878 stop:1384 length:507 start_codon:yes stop_codon:yes gene_type:complete
MAKKSKNKLTRLEYKKIIDSITSKLEKKLEITDLLRKKLKKSIDQILEQTDNSKNPKEEVEFPFTNPFMRHMMKMHYMKKMGIKDVRFVDDLNPVKLRAIFEKCMEIEFMANTTYMNISIEEGIKISKEDSNKSFMKELDKIVLKINKDNDNGERVLKELINEENNVL